MTHEIWKNDTVAKILPFDQWTQRAEKHTEKVASYADDFVERRSVNKKHPVHDFLFTYYRFSPAKLKQWVPAIDEALEITPTLQAHYPWLNDYWFTREGDVLHHNPERIHQNIKGVAKFIVELCRQINLRPPRYGCFGLHEWAMVYQLPQNQIRHQAHPLRLKPEEISSFVESQSLCCTHYDAYRFFTSEATPRNLFKPTLETRLQNEQAGCIHVNMDLYKWTAKLWPWVGADFLAETFFFALEARELDMRASPYDLIADGYEPIRIETESGRREYQRLQQQLAERSASLRQRLLNFAESIQ